MDQSQWANASLGEIEADHGGSAWRHGLWRASATLWWRVVAASLASASLSRLGARDKTLIWIKRAHSSAQPTPSPQLEDHVGSRGNLFTSLDEDPPEGRPCDGRKGMVRY